MGQPRSHVGPQFYWPFYSHILSTKTSFCHMTKNLRHTKSPELFLWSPSLEACTINNLPVYMTNEGDKLRCCLARMQHNRDSNVSKNFQVPPFQQCKEMPADCFCDPTSVKFIQWIIYFSDSTVVSSFTLSNPTASCWWQVWSYCTSSENMFPLLFPC